MCGLIIMIISVRSLSIINTLFRKAASQFLVQLLRMTKIFRCSPQLATHPSRSRLSRAVLLGRRFSEPTRG